MINKFLYWLTARLPCRLIKIEDRPYLERYYLGHLLGVTFYLHRFVSSDSERHVHNHPWRRGVALVLTGGYIEERAFDLCPAANVAGCISRYRRVRWLNRVDANTFHRIHNAKPGTWTLFCHGARAKVGSSLKGWGFLQQQSGPGVAATGTLFIPYPSTPEPWWEDAKTGAEIGREPL